MKRRDIQKTLRSKDKAHIEITLTSTENAKEATIHFKSQVRMSGLDFLMALIDYANDLAEQLYTKANETDQSKN